MGPHGMGEGCTHDLSASVVDRRRRLPDLPAQLLRQRRRRHRRPARHHRPSRLPARLGITSIWLSPVYPSPQDDNGYDICDYRTIDAEFGTLDEFDELVREANERGIELVLDLVVNHTCDEHPWFVESAVLADNPKRDWYWWLRLARARAGMAAPSRRTGLVLRRPAWTLDEATGEYYLHLFSPPAARPELGEPELREAIYAMMRWWLDRGVDGFRMDVINLISKDPSLPDGVTGTGAGGPALERPPSTGRGSTSSSPRCTARCSATPREFLTVGETPGAAAAGRAALLRPGARRGRHGVPVRARHASTAVRGGKWDLSRSTWWRSRRTWPGGSWRWPRTGWNSSVLGQP